MNQNKIDIIGLQFPQAFPEGGDGGFISLVPIPDLRREEERFPIQPARTPPVADALLILVGLSGVDQSDPGVERFLHDGGCRLGRNLEHAVAENRDRISIRQTSQLRYKSPCHIEFPPCLVRPPEGGNVPDPIVSPARTVYQPFPAGRTTEKW